MQILKIVIIIADNNDLIDILIMDILCPNRITNQYSIIFKFPTHDYVNPVYS